MRSPWFWVVVVAGIVVRLWIMATPLGVLLADEAYTGLQAAEILTGRTPVVISGIGYTAPIESYVFAPLVWLIGLHVVPLKLLSSLGWGLAALFVVGAARRFASDRVAMLAGAFVWLAPGALAVVATRAYAGYSAGLATTALLLWAVQPRCSDAGEEILRRRDSFAIGFLTGFAIYIHPMYAAAVLPMAAVPALRHRRRLAAWWLPAAGGAIVGLSPFIVWNAKNGWPSLSQPAAETSGPVDRFLRFGTDLLPRVVGMRTVDGAWTLGPVVGGLVVVAVVALAVVGAVTLLRSRRPGAVAVVAPLALSWFVMAGLTNLSFQLDGRYGIINLPFLCVALAAGIDRLVELRPTVIAGAIVVWLGLLTAPYVLQQGGREIGDPNRATTDLVAAIESRGFDRLAGYYWAVLPVEYISDQRIRSAVAGYPYVVLFANTQRLVESTPPDRLAMAFLGEAPGPLLRLPADAYERVDLGPIVLYLPRPDAEG